MMGLMLLLTGTENFDIEVFEVEEGYSGASKVDELLRPLYFSAKYPEYSDGIRRIFLEYVEYSRIFLEYAEYSRIPRIF